MTPSPALPRARALVTLVSAMGLLGAAVVAAALWVGATSPGALGAYLLLVVVMTLLTDVTAIDLRVGRHAESFTWSELSVVLGLALLPVEHLLLTSVAVGVAYFVTGQPAVKWVHNVGSYAVGLALAAGVCRSVTTPGWDRPLASALALLAGAATFAVWNKVTTDAAIALAQDRPMSAVLRSQLPSTVFVFLCNVGLGFGCLALARVHPDLIWAAPACVAVAALLNRCYLQLAQDRAAWRALESASRELTALDEQVLIDAALNRVAVLMQADGAELRLSTEARDVVHRLGRRDRRAVQEPPLQAELPTVTVARAQGRAGLPVECTEASVPLDAAAHRLGQLVVTYDGAVRLTRRERSQLTTYAGALAVALCNARLHAQVRDQAERSAHAALHDPLTGLPNRTLLQSHLDVARSQGEAFAVLLLDLDLFKPVNDTYGHEAGDEVLRVTAARLRAAVRPADVVARLGGDEFAVLLHDTTSVTASVERLQAVVAAPIAVGAVTVCIGVSIGHALHPRDGSSCEALLRAADAAMYRVKRRRNRRSVDLAPRTAEDTSSAAVSTSAAVDLDRVSTLHLVAPATRR